MSRFTQPPAKQPTKTAAPRTKVKPTVVSQRVESQRVESQPQAAQPFVAEQLDTMAAPMEMPADITPRRLLTANVSWLLSFCSSYYWGATLTTYLAAACLLTTGSAFLTFMVGVIGAVLSLFGAWQLSKRVFALIVEFDFGTAQREIDRNAASARSYWAAKYASFRSAA